MRKKPSHFPAQTGRVSRQIAGIAVLCALVCVSTGAGAAQLDWDGVTWLPTGSLAQTYNGIAGGDITVTISGDTAPANWYDGTPLIDQFFTGGLAPAENSLSIKTDYNTGSGSSVTVTIDFTHAGGVSNVFFDLFDIDSDNSGGGGNDFTDRVEVEATNGSGTIFPDTVTPSAFNALDGPNAIIGTADLTSTNTNQGNASFGFSQSGITQVRITYSNEEPPRDTRIQFTALHDVNFSTAFPILSTSTKSVVDNNGSPTLVGDILTYTVSLVNTGGVAGVVDLLDDVPQYVDSLVVTNDGGGTDSSTTTGGANGNGLVDISGITVPAGGSVDVVFTVRVQAGTPAGSIVSNTATITNPTGPDGNPSAPDVTVVSSAPPASGNKQLYLQTGGLALSRSRPASSPGTSVNHAGGGAGGAPVTTWDLDVATTGPMTFTGATIPTYLYLTESGPGSWRRVRVRLYYDSGGGWTQIGVVTRWAGNLPGAVPREELFSVPNSIDGVAMPSGTQYRLTIQNVTAQANRNLQVHQAPAAGWSRVLPFTTTVINVDSDATYEAAYPNVVTKGVFNEGELVSIRAVVSDPFGSADISSAQVAITDPGGSPVAGSPFTMAELLPLTTAASKTFEYNYTLPAGSPGSWSYVITAFEGVEGTISHQSFGGFLVNAASPLLVLAKTNVTQWDPVNLASFPKAIPGSYTDYTLELTNSGTGQPDSESIFISDPIPTNLQLFLGDLDGSGSPVDFTDFSSGLSFVFISLGSITDDVAFSDDNGASYNYDPTAPANLPDTDADGFNSAITDIRIQPSGQMNGSSGAPDPRFSAVFRVRLD